MQQQSKPSLLQRLSNFAHFMLTNTDNPHLVGRDHNHLEQNYRRRFTAPDVASEELRTLLVNDPLFQQALAGRSGRVIVRATVVGNKLRANLYRLERFPHGQLTPPYNPDWRKSDIVDYFANVAVGDGGTSVVITPIVREFRTDETYDWYEPFASYQRLLTPAELTGVDCYSQPHYASA